MTVNDGKGLFDKFGMLDEISKKLEALVDTHGTFRCGLIWDISGMLKALNKGLAEEEKEQAKMREEQEAYIKKMEAQLAESLKK